MSLQPAIALDADMTRDLDGILDSAAEVLQCAQEAMAAGQLAPHHLDMVIHLRNDMGQLLALFEDGPAYGTIDDEQRQVLRHYEMIAADMVASTSGGWAP
jgi:hypothetical protein